IPSSECPENGCNREAAYIWLNPLASLLHGQTMVDHRVDHSGLNLIRDNGSPSCSFSSSSSSSSSFSSSSSSSYSHSSAFLITSHFNVAINCSPNQELTCGHHIAKAFKLHNSLGNGSF